MSCLAAIAALQRRARDMMAESMRCSASDRIIGSRSPPTCVACAHALMSAAVAGKQMQEVRSFQESSLEAEATQHGWDANEN